MLLLMKSLSKIYLFSFKPFQAFTDEESFQAFTEEEPFQAFTDEEPFQAFTDLV